MPAQNLTQRDLRAVLRRAALTTAASLGLLLCVDPHLRGPDVDVYYAYTRSLLIDGDLLLFDEFRALQHVLFVTPTGYATALQNVGAAFFWLPFLALAHALISAANALLDAGIAPNGFNAIYRLWLNAGNWLYGVLALVLCYRFVRRYSARRAAISALVFIALGTSYFYYMGYLAPSPGILSALVAVLLLFVWDDARRADAWPHWLLLGVLAGVLIALANYNVTYLLLPLITLALQARDGVTRRVLCRAFSLTTGVVLGMLPQLLVWRSLFGSLFVNPYAGQLGWLQPHIPEILFSTYHGLLFYAPLLLLMLTGLVPLFRRDRALAVACAAIFAAQTYINSVNLAWWGGDSFGMRYFLGVTPLCVLCLAALLDARPSRWLYGLASLCTMWTVLLFLGVYSQRANISEYFTLAQQLEHQRATLSALPQIVTGGLFAPRSALTLIMLPPFALLMYMTLHLSERMPTPHSTIRPRAALLIAAAPLLAAAIIWRAELLGAQRLPALRTEPAYRELPRAVGDPVDLSYTYSERGRYFFRAGARAAAERDFARAAEVFAPNSWSVMAASDWPRETAPLDWMVNDSVQLVGYALDTQMGQLAVALYWLVRAEPVAPFALRFSVRDAAGSALAETELLPTHGRRDVRQWRAGELIYDRFTLNTAASAVPLSIELTILDAATRQPLSHKVLGP